MIIDMFKKGNTLFPPLEKMNQLIIDNDKRSPEENETFTREIVSPWFDPDGVRELWTGRSYPEYHSCQSRPEYSLILHVANYLTIFLTELLFRDRKEIVIEDFGCGDGRLFVYLKELGFQNFSGWDNWSQIPYPIYGDMMLAIGLDRDKNPRLNDPTVNPVVVNNSHAPFIFISYGFDDRQYPRGKTEARAGRCENLYPDRDISNAELLTFYSTNEWEQFGHEMLPKRGFKFLCKDSDDMTVAWCREDKYEEFKGKIIDYV